MRTLAPNHVHCIFISQVQGLYRFRFNVSTTKTTTLRAIRWPLAAALLKTIIRSIHVMKHEKRQDFVLDKVSKKWKQLSAVKLLNYIHHRKRFLIGWTTTFLIIFSKTLIVFSDWLSSWNGYILTDSKETHSIEEATIAMKSNHRRSMVLPPSRFTRKLTEKSKHK